MLNYCHLLTVKLKPRLLIGVVEGRNIGDEILLLSILARLTNIYVNMTQK